MSFADPQTVTLTALNGGAVSLPRTSVGKNSSEYSSAENDVKLSASSSYGKRTRRVVRLDHQKIADDPFAVNGYTKVSASVYVVIDVPTLGYTKAEQLELWTGLKGQLAASSEALMSKLLGGEN